MEIIITAYKGDQPEISEDSPSLTPLKVTVSQKLVRGLVLEVEGKRYHVNASHFYKAIRALE